VIYNHGLSITKTSKTVGALLQSSETHFAAQDSALGTALGTAMGTTQSAAGRSGRQFARSSNRLATAAALAAALLSASGCGNNYRPVITAINPVGPAAQPTKYAVAISDPNLGAANGTLPGLVTFVDFSGDTVLITANIGVKPYYLILNSGGTNGVTLNADGTVNSFSISTSLIASNVTQTTLLANPLPTDPLPASVLPLSSATYITQPGRKSVAELTGSGLLSLQQELANVGPDPIYIAGISGASRVYVLSPSVPAGAAGTATPIETSTNTPSPALPVGVNPVYGVMTADTKRAFVLNNGSNTVTVVDAQNNRLDTGVANGTIADPAAVAPLWADFAPTLSELVVANQGNSTTPCPNRPNVSGCGSVSIFSIPLCSAAAQSVNPNCDPSNPIDAVGFGNLVANIPVGVDPIMVGVLQDGTQAYVINKGDSSVSVINLKTNTVSATISVPASPNPTFIAVTTGTPTGKVYVTSSTSTSMTVIRTDTNQVDTTVPLQGYGVQVRMTAP
jgi:YVTN family beta-propeller protein